MSASLTEKRLAAATESPISTCPPGAVTTGTALVACGELNTFQLFQSLHACPSFARTQTRSEPMDEDAVKLVLARSAAATGIVTFTPASMPFTEKWPLPVVESQNSYWVGVSPSWSRTENSDDAATVAPNSSVPSEAAIVGAWFSTEGALMDCGAIPKSVLARTACFCPVERPSTLPAVAYW